MRSTAVYFYFSIFGSRGSQRIVVENDNHRALKCPVCDGKRRLLHSRGMDYFFRASSDLYDVYQGTNPRCGAASISPKPNSAQLERAYSQYYTHEGAAEHLS